MATDGCDECLALLGGAKTLVLARPREIMVVAAAAAAADNKGASHFQTKYHVESPLVPVDSRETCPIIVTKKTN
jgi:hypothetical protein